MTRLSGCFFRVNNVYSWPMDEPRHFRQDLFEIHLKKLVGSSDGVEAAFLVNAEGFTMASAGTAFGEDETAALSALAGDALKRARKSFGFGGADEVIFTNPGRRYIVCKEFEHAGETTGCYLLVVVTSEASYDAVAITAAVANINDALEDFY
ncbi:MAG: roadblock/LC7 domain-containing protein [Candidatus Coatesbacteria bacterium]|nr:MAG: roadblock/LC7 domain-containing protein [Candidatus Coatesbacteria bacterium]